jgi:hypothetical protein
VTAEGAIDRAIMSRLWQPTAKAGRLGRQSCSRRTAESESPSPVEWKSFADDPEHLPLFIHLTQSSAIQIPRGGRESLVSERCE